MIEFFEACLVISEGALDNDEGMQCPNCDAIPTYLIDNDNGPLCWDCEAPMQEVEETND